MSSPVTFFLGIVLAAVGGLVLYLFARRNGFAPDFSRRSFMVDIGMRYARASGADLDNRVDFIVMKSLLERGVAQEYYWECWREGIFIPPPPPFAMVFPQFDNENQEQQEETYKL